MRRAKSRRTIKPRFGASGSSEDLLSLKYEEFSSSLYGNPSALCLSADDRPIHPLPTIPFTIALPRGNGSS
jgi:hypothetical protein